MRPGRAPTLEFLRRPAPAVARDLVGAYLVRRLPDGARLVGRIVEVEAYLGDGSDPASHCHRGETPRNRAMFGPPGRLYVYRSYGIHRCANVVCEAAGRGAAVLLRALEPVEGLDVMRANRGLGPETSLRQVAGGPGRLCEALAIGLDDYGASLLRGPIALRLPPPGARPPRLATSARIGIRKAAELPLRFYDRDSPAVSVTPGRPSRAGRPGGRRSARATPPRAAAT